MTRRLAPLAAWNLVLAGTVGLVASASASPPAVVAESPESSEAVMGELRDQLEAAQRLQGDGRYGDGYWLARSAVEHALSRLPSDHTSRRQLIDQAARLDDQRDAVCKPEVEDLLRTTYHSIAAGWVDEEGQPPSHSETRFALGIWTLCFEQHSLEYATILLRAAELSLSEQAFERAYAILGQARETLDHVAAAGRTEDFDVALRWGEVQALQGMGRGTEAYDRMLALVAEPEMSRLVDRESLLGIVGRSALAAGAALDAKRLLDERDGLQATAGRAAWERIETAALLARAHFELGELHEARRWTRTAEELDDQAKDLTAPRVEVGGAVVTLLPRTVASRDGRASSRTNASGSKSTAGIHDSTLAMDTLLSQMNGTGGARVGDIPTLLPTSIEPVAGARATALIDLARVRTSLGDYAEAETSIRAALELDLRNYGWSPCGDQCSILASPKPGLDKFFAAEQERSEWFASQPSPAVGRDFIALANAQLLTDQPERALESLARAEAAFPRGNPIVAVTLQSNRAVAYEQLGDWELAVTGHREALSKLTALLGDEHPKVLIARHNLAAALSLSGRHAESEAEFLEVEARIASVRGEGSPELANVRRHRAIVAYGRDDLGKAAELIIAAARGRGRALIQMVELGSESERLAYVASMTRSMDALLTLAVHPSGGSEPLRTAALETVLQRKGLALEVTAHEHALARDTRSLAELARLRELHGQRARLWLRGDDQARAAALREVEAELARLERGIAGRVFHATLGSVDDGVDDTVNPVEAVAGTLGPDQVLIEFVRFQHVDAHANNSRERWAEARYAAFVLGRDNAVFAADLGDADTIDAEVARFRELLQDPRSDPTETALALHRRLIAPLEMAIGGRREWFVAPGGALALVPLEALMTDDRRYLVGQISTTYVTSGRDLLRGGRARGPGAALVLAAPDYDAGDGEGAPLGRRFAPLPGTAREALRIREHLPDVEILDGAAATKQALLAVDSPRLLHVATHGYFLGDVQPDPEAGSRALTLTDAGPTLAQLGIGDPMLRSGLALAGANRGADGLLTAAEASSLDLSGTALVVLSACETGVGEVSSSQGTFGLQRSVLLAGAQTLVMSLWSVSDDATAATMDGYYRRLVAGGGRSEALRHAKLELLADPGTAHPYYWAPFIALGRPESLTGDPVAPEFGDDDPQPLDSHGPRCQLGRGAGGALGWTGLLVLGGLVAWRRRSPRLAKTAGARPAAAARTARASRPARDP